MPIPEIAPKAKISWWNNLPFLMIHLSCLLVFVTGVSPLALGVFFLTFVSRMFGLTAGYHRYFSHRSFKTSRVFQFILAFLGACSLQRDPLWWAAHHRNHHRHSDTEKDSHSPTVQGFLWAHMGWVLYGPFKKINPEPLVSDFCSYPELRFLHRHQKFPGFFFLFVMILISMMLPKIFPLANIDPLQIVVWGFSISTVLLFHVTFSVNSLAHMFGSRPFKTKDNSRNNALVALLTMGEGWHNNHHQYPYAEKHGIHWWQLDLTHGILRFLSWFRIVWDLKLPQVKP